MEPEGVILVFIVHKVINSQFSGHSSPVIILYHKEHHEYPHLVEFTSDLQNAENPWKYNFDSVCFV